MKSLAPVRAHLVSVALVLLPSLAALADTRVDVPAEPRSIELPPETARLIESDAPGYARALQKCQICHSVDYIAYQPPSLDIEAWTNEVRKMRDRYGAPITEEDAVFIGAYLARAYGSATEGEAEAAIGAFATGGVAPGS